MCSLTSIAAAMAQSRKKLKTSGQVRYLIVSIPDLRPLSYLNVFLSFIVCYEIDLF